MSAPRLPDELWDELAAFFAAGKTGKIEITVRRGRVTGFEVRASFQVAPERPAAVVPIGVAAVRRVPSRHD